MALVNLQDPPLCRDSRFQDCYAERFSKLPPEGVWGRGGWVTGCCERLTRTYARSQLRPTRPFYWELGQTQPTLRSNLNAVPITLGSCTLPKSHTLSWSPCGSCRHIESTVGLMLWLIPVHASVVIQGLTTVLTVWSFWSKRMRKIGEEVHWTSQAAKKLNVMPTGVQVTVHLLYRRQKKTRSMGKIETDKSTRPYYCPYYLLLSINVATDLELQTLYN